MEKLTKNELDTWRQYSKMKGSNIHRCKVNNLNVHFNGDYEHELAKFKLFWELRKQGSKIITECWDKEGNRRDLVDISAREIYEIETTPERAARFMGQPINIIPVGWSFEDEKWKRLKAKKRKIKMSYRQSILNFLKERYPNKFSAAQIVYYLGQQGLSESVIFANIKKLIEQEEIGYEWTESLNQNKRPCRIYWWKNG